MAVVSVAVLGCGAVTRLYHGPALAYLERAGVVNVAAVYDPNPVAASAAASMFDGARAVATEREALGADLIIVASPPAYHAEQTIEALTRGAAVICEKPLASTIADAERMIASAARAGATLAVSFVRRFLPAAQAVRAALGRRCLGELSNVSCFEGGPFHWPAESTSFFDRKHGGGVLADIGPHMFDLFQWWLGAPDAIEYEDDAMGGVEANAYIRLRYATFQVEARLSRDWAMPNEYRFRGSNGWMAWDMTEPGSIQLGFAGCSPVLKGEMREPTSLFGHPAAGDPGINFEQCFVAQIENVVAAVRSGASLVSPGEAGLQSLNMVEACYRARRLVAMDWLSAEERAAAAEFSAT